MSPQEKAKELVNKFSSVGLQQREEGLKCALIAVDEMISLLTEITNTGIEYYSKLNELLELKEEIEKL
jgi:hypothetical protein